MVPDLENITPEPNPVTGWVLPAAIRLDYVTRGYLSYLCTCGTIKRQANFVALSILEERDADHLTSRFEAAGLIRSESHPDPLGRIAHVLITKRAQDIYEALFNAPSSAFVRLLHRIGNGPLPQRAYGRLIDLLYLPEHRDRARLLTQRCPISVVSIEAALRLPTPLLRQEVICRLHSIEQIEQLGVALKLVMSLLPESAHGEIWQSLSSLSPTTSLSTWLRRLIDKVPSFAIIGPLPDDADVTLLSSPESMRDVGRRFSNCLQSKLPFVALQRNVYYVWHGNPGAIVELESFSREQWAISGIFGPKNGRVDAQTLRCIRAKFERTGILVKSYYAQHRDLNKCAKLLGIADWSNPNLGEEEFDLTELESDV